MTHRPSTSSGPRLSEALLHALLEEHRTGVLPRFERFWAYYRNTLRPVGLGGPDSRAGWYRLPQEVGLPSRIRGILSSSADDRAAYRREVVIENDIAWRLQAMVDFMLSRPVRIASTARDESTRRAIDAILDAIWERSGGIALMQDMALLGHVFGHVDLILRIDEARLGALARTNPGANLSAMLDPEAIRVELVEPRRGIPLLNRDDYRRLDAYIIHTEREMDEPEDKSTVSSLLTGRARSRRKRQTVTEVITASSHRLYEDDRLVRHTEPAWSGARVPVVHIQNISQPFAYEGQGEVEPLIPLQDELNTRLSDRACRVTMQSFKMYLAKGIEQFDRAPVTPGVIWSTDNPDASIESFGGDADSPSETAHILEIREALDKISGVPPLASGVVRAKIGNLSSANALRITLMGLLSKTERKRITYGGGIARMCELILGALDHFGILRTEERDRTVRLTWPDPIPLEPRDEIAAAEGKLRLGVPRSEILDELGHQPTDAGVT